MIFINPDSMNYHNRLSDKMFNNQETFPELLEYIVRKY